MGRLTQFLFRCRIKFQRFVAPEHRVFVAAQVLFAAAAVIFFAIWGLAGWLPAPGIAVAVVAGIAATMSIHGEMNGGHKALWMLLIGAFIFIEMLAIHHSQVEQTKEQQKILREEREHFGEIGKGIQGSITKSQQHFDATMLGLNTLIQQSGEISKQAKQAVYAATGGDSFCFFELNGPRDGLVLSHPGEYRLSDLEVDLIDYTTKKTENNPPRTFPPHTIAPYFYELSKGDREDIGAMFSAVNGGWFETLQLRKVNGVWQQALKVERAPKQIAPGKKAELDTMRLQVDPLYPKMNGKVEWCTFVTTAPTQRANPCIPSSRN